MKTYIKTAEEFLDIQKLSALENQTLNGGKANKDCGCLPDEN